VIAGGVNDIYPRENDKLYAEICEKGAVVSEMPWGTKATAKLFPKRNRIVSGLSLALIVVEAALRSGSLITARLAAEQGREVYAVPGSPLDGRAAGPNALIQQGAKLVMSSADILEDIASMAPRPALKNAGDEDAAPLFDFSEIKEESVPSIPSAPEANASLEARILNSLSPVPSDIDELIRTMDAPASAVQTALVMLEMDQKIERVHGNRVALCA
jgi:DNA processing protein